MGSTASLEAGDSVDSVVGWLEVVGGLLWRLVLWELRPPRP